MNICSDTQYPEKDEVCAVDVVDADAVSRVAAAIAPQPLVERTAALFAALADPTRFRILDALSREELCVCDLAAIARISQSGVSHQLRLLRDRGLVTYRRDGNRAVYRLSDEHVRDLIRIGVEHASEGAVDV
ncbi:MAG TPA: metalloregulator ArsR/SmtB family transcription factor [Coriobacteriia bacterium]|nr:metalloregulator ArsR/SmtB family transcription factor [Coriobacteriia bacterium]